MKKYGTTGKCLPLVVKDITGEKNQMTVWPNHLKSEQIQEGDTYFFENIGKLSFYFKMFFKSHCCFLLLIFLSKTEEEEEAWHRGCDAGSHTHFVGFLATL